MVYNMFFESLPNKLGGYERHAEQLSFYLKNLFPNKRNDSQAKERIVFFIFIFIFIFTTPPLYPAAILSAPMSYSFRSVR